MMAKRSKKKTCHPALQQAIKELTLEQCHKLVLGMAGHIAFCYTMMKDFGHGDIGIMESSVTNAVHSVEELQYAFEWMGDVQDLCDEYDRRKVERN